MRMESKFETEDESSSRAVSPVIGVILMVAITVILAAVIAAFVLDLGQSSGANPSAGYSIDGNGEDMSVQLSNIDRLDSWAAYCDDRPDNLDFEDANVGERFDVNDFSSDDNCDPDSTSDDVTIIGEYNGNEATL
ncbi:type IV pilin N-terminal domain-containing protein [Natronosalvus vescus]|uniref:type IV pilin N-terminal domain-containing protein n=1 Tax=Natronosalvus vescus TaxID=2953881 RepID=UPI00288018E5|nr:type IV pilin N-terminal domain-containing protein [Natronosalvus vescus]